jgi:hypothetical protein
MPYDDKGNFLYPLPKRRRHTKHSYPKELKNIASQEASPSTTSNFYASREPLIISIDIPAHATLIVNGQLAKWR